MATRKTHRKTRTGASNQIKKPSIATRKSPSARLVRRRKATMKAPAGFYANPARKTVKKEHCYEVRCERDLIAVFPANAAGLKHAKMAAQMYADHLMKPCSIEKVLA